MATWEQVSNGGSRVGRNSRQGGFHQNHANRNPPAAGPPGGDRPPPMKNLLTYLDEYLMPLLNDLREEQGSWDGVPALADLVAEVSGATKQRRVIREQIRLALLELAGPKGEAA